MTTDEENRRLKIEMSEIKARHKIELQQVQKKMEQEMEDVHQRCVCIRTCVRACVCACMHECLRGMANAYDELAGWRTARWIREDVSLHSSSPFSSCVE